MPGKKELISKAKAEIAARYAQKGYSDYRISVVDDYALSIRIPASEKTEQQTAFQNAYTTFGLFAETGVFGRRSFGDHIGSLL